MRRAFDAILTSTLLLSFLLPPAAQASTRYGVRRTRPVPRTSYSVPVPEWLDLSAQIPTTKLDEYAEAPYLSFATSRGDQWLAGNKNQLFLVSDKTVKDLTPELKNSGFVSIRQVAGDGQAWLVIGDSSFWNAQPDLAYLYDGMYWKNVSFLMYNLPPEEWVGQAVGKRGLWVIPTSEGVYQWDTALTQPAAVAYPAAFREPGVSDVNFHAVEDGWVAEFTQPNGPKTKLYGSPVYDRRFFFFDGTSFKEITGMFKGLGDRSVVASNGGRIFAFGVARDMAKKVSIQAFESDGRGAADKSGAARRLWDIRDTRPLLIEGRAAWMGKGWLLSDTQKNLAFCDTTTCRKLNASRDNFLEAGYGKNGSALLVGYARDGRGGLKPRMAKISL